MGRSRPGRCDDLATVSGRRAVGPVGPVPPVRSANDATTGPAAGRDSVHRIGVWCVRAPTLIHASSTCLCTNTAPDRSRTDPLHAPCDNRGPMADRSDLAPHGRAPATGPARIVAGFPTDRISRPTRRRAGVFQRALRREVSRLHDPRRLAAMAILIAVAGIFGAGLIARGELAGADARAYWAGVRIWLAGGNPYAPTGPFLPYVYAPWMLPLFAPWALLPWDVAWFVWRGGALLLLFWTIHWAYKRKPLADRDRRPHPGVPDRGQPRHREHHPDARVHALGLPLRRPADRRAAVGPGDLDEVGPGALLAHPRPEGPRLGRGLAARGGACSAWRCCR